MSAQGRLKWDNGEKMVSTKDTLNRFFGITNWLYRWLKVRVFDFRYNYILKIVYEIPQCSNQQSEQIVLSACDKNCPMPNFQCFLMLRILT